MTTISLPPLIDRLRQAVGVENVLAARSDLVVYECDGFTIEKNSPDVVVFPRNTADVVRVVKLCNELGVPFLPRGAGTSLAGGCLPVGGGVMIVLTRMKRILEINLRDRYAVVEPGVVKALANVAACGKQGSFFAIGNRSQFFGVARRCFTPMPPFNTTTFFTSPVNRAAKSSN